MLATLFLSQGTPMLLAGDEIGNGQRGNNNAYAQDNEVGWTDWHDPDNVPYVDVPLPSGGRRTIELQSVGKISKNMRIFVVLSF